MIYKVHSLREGSSAPPNGYMSWLDYWKKATGQKAIWCHQTNCLNNSLALATDGAHVQLDSEYNDNRWWIVPLCHLCNTQFGADFSVSGPLVSATDPTEILW